MRAVGGGKSVFIQELSKKRAKKEVRRFGAGTTIGGDVKAFYFSDRKEGGEKKSPVVVGKKTGKNRGKGKTP